MKIIQGLGNMMEHPLDSRWKIELIQWIFPGTYTYLCVCICGFRGLVRLWGCWFGAWDLGLIRA